MLLCCVFRSLALWPYLLSSRPMFHGAPALTPQAGGARGRLHSHGLGMFPHPVRDGGVPAQ